jgi:hypothetical protein
MNNKILYGVIAIVLVVIIAVVAILLLSMPAAPSVFSAELNGANEVPPVETMATGEAMFTLSEDGMTLHFTLDIANLENITMAHIHLAPVGVNGAVVVWLYPSAPPEQLIPGTFTGTLAEGDITADSLVGSLEGQPLSSLIDEINSGNAYVNVHTSQYPAGEIRDQISP